MAVGDLVVDMVVHLEEPPAGRRTGSDAGSGTRSVVVNLGSDAPAVVIHRQGGSAANVCVAAAGLGAAARFVGQVGDDPTGRWLVDSLRAAGVEPAVRVAGRTGSVVVLCHADGERSMITDRGASAELADTNPAWLATVLDGVRALHLPLYSLASDPLRSTALALAGGARERGAVVSLDLSSTSLLAALGPATVIALVAGLAPDVVLANEAEAAWARAEGLALPAAVVVEKRGPAAALVTVPGRPPVAVPARPLGPVADSTGAGDAFAAGWLTATLGGADPVEAARAGHRAAADRLRALGAGS